MRSFEYLLALVLGVQSYAADLTCTSSLVARSEVAAQIVAMRTRGRLSAFDTRRRARPELDKIISGLFPNLNLPTHTPVPSKMARRLSFEIKAEVKRGDQLQFRLSLLTLDARPVAILRDDKTSTGHRAWQSVSPVSADDLEPALALRSFLLAAYRRPDPWLAPSHSSGVPLYGDGTYTLDDRSESGFSINEDLEIFRMETWDAFQPRSFTSVRRTENGNFQIYRNLGHGPSVPLAQTYIQAAAAFEQLMLIIDHECLLSNNLKLYIRDRETSSLTIAPIPGGKSVEVEDDLKLSADFANLISGPAETLSDGRQRFKIERSSLITSALRSRLQILFR